MKQDEAVSIVVRALRVNKIFRWMCTPNMQQSKKLVKVIKLWSISFFICKQCFHLQIVRKGRQMWWKTITVKPVLSGHSKRRPKLVFKTNYRLMQVKSIAECSKGSILHYFQPSLSYHLSLRSLFCLYMSGRLRQVLLYVAIICNHVHPWGLG